MFVVASASNGPKPYAYWHSLHFSGGWVGLGICLALSLRSVRNARICMPLGEITKEQVNLKKVSSNILLVSEFLSQISILFFTFTAGIGGCVVHPKVQGQKN